MPSIIESLYRPSEKDRLSGLAIRRFHQEVSVVQTAALTSATFAVCPPDRVQVITGVGAYITPGVAAVWSVVWYWFPDGVNAGQQFITMAPGLSAAGVNSSCQTPSVEFMLLPGDRVSCRLEVSTSANLGLTAAIWGYEIPRANLQR